MTQKFQSRLELHSIINGVPARQLLSSATNVAVVEELNADYYVTFDYPKLPNDSERYDGLIEDNYVRFPDGMTDKGVSGQKFVIKRVDEIRKGLRIYKHVEAYHVAFSLGQYYLDDYIDFAAAKPPEYLLALIGNNTPFTFAVEGSFTPQDVFDFGEKSKLTLLNQARELYGAERSFNNYNITLTTRKGGNYGVEIRYRKNLTGITRKSHALERVTRLYGYGKNGLTIEGLPGHTVKYIDSQYFDADNPYMGAVEFPEIDEQAALLDAMQRHLKTVELPKVSYEIDFIDLEKVDIDFKSEAIREVGDTVTVIDEVMGYRFDARVQRYVRYPFEPKRGSVTLANFRELTDGDIAFQATAAGKKAMVYTSNNAVLKGVKYDDSITLVDGMGMAVSDDLNRIRVRLGQVGPGDYGFAAYNKAGNKTIWLDATTGDGRFSGTLEAATINGGTINGSTVNAGKIVGGTIQGAAITAGSVTGTTISGGTINGTAINGSLITGGTVRTAGTTQHIALEPGGLRSYDNSGVKRISIDTTDAFGYQELRFYGQSGGNVGVVSGTNGQFNVAAKPGSSLVAGGSNVTIGGEVSYVNFQNRPVIGFPMSNVSGLQGELTGLQNSKANVSEAGFNLVFNPASRLLKMFSRTGVELASVYIPAS